MPRISADKIGGVNVAAFLDLIASAPAEGTASVVGSDDGYNVEVGGTLFHSYADHPRPHVWIERIKQFSSAAGRYQILAHYFDVYKKQLGLFDFSPESQDLIAFQMIKECHAVRAIQEGNIAEAIKLCGSRWASLPANNYGQARSTSAELVAAYIKAGGKEATA